MEIPGPPRSIKSSLFGSHVSEEVDYPVRIPPFVVVPRNNLEEPFLSLEVILEGGQGVIDGRAARVDKVCRNELLFAIFENPLQIRLRGFLHQRINLFDRGIFPGPEGQVDD